VERVFALSDAGMPGSGRRVRLVGVGDVGRAVVGAVAEPHVAPAAGPVDATFRVGAAIDLVAAEDVGWCFVIGRSTTVGRLPAFAEVNRGRRFLDPPGPWREGSFEVLAADVGEAVVAWAEAGAPNLDGPAGTTASFACGRGVAAGDGPADWLDAVEGALDHCTFDGRSWAAARVVVGRVAARREPDAVWLARLEAAIAGTFYARPVVTLRWVAAEAGVRVALVAHERGPPPRPASVERCLRSPVDRSLCE
jgi:hypothetical protein